MTSPTPMLLLLGVPPESLPANGEGFELQRAPGPLAATAQLSRSSASVLVVDPACDWASAFVARLPPERRPATLAVGAADAVAPELFDEWVPPSADEGELRVRLKLSAARARVRRQVARRAFVDALTSLPNRRAVVRTLVREAGRSRRDGGGLSLVLLDLDGFKTVNEQAGHSAGDRLLRRVGGALRRVTRADELCGRIGGDEFAIVIRGYLENAVQAAARAERALAELGVGVSSAASERLPGERLRQLYRRADRALAQVKERRRAEGLARTRLEAALAPYEGDEDEDDALLQPRVAQGV